MRNFVSVILLWVLALGGVGRGQDAKAPVCGDMPQKAALTKNDTASIEGAITAIAMLRQCQIVNRPGHKDAGGSKNMVDEQRCISKTLSSGAYSAIAHVDLSTNPFYSNVGVRELIQCVNTPTTTDAKAAAKSGDDTNGKILDTVTKIYAAVKETR